VIADQGQDMAFLPALEDRMDTVHGLRRINRMNMHVIFQQDIGMRGRTTKGRRDTGLSKNTTVKNLENW
jgi:hypothetical protein